MSKQITHNTPRKRSAPAYKIKDTPGAYIVLEVLEYKKRPTADCSSKKYGWIYRVKCKVFVAEYIKNQQGLHYARGQKLRNCIACSNRKNTSNTYHPPVHEIMGVPEDTPDFTKMKLREF